MEYSYKGMPLKVYCEKKHYNYDKIVDRINKLKDMGIYLYYSDEKYVEIVLKELEKKERVKDNNNIKYQGRNLDVYCKVHKLNYCFIKKKYYKLKNNPKYSKFSDEVLILMAINYKKYKNNETVSKTNVYSYKGKSMRSYCLENNISYSVIRTRIKNLKKYDKFKSLDNNEIVKIAFENYEMAKKDAGVNKYYYNGQSLRKYCLENNLPYKQISRIIYKLANKQEYVDLSDDELVIKGLEEFNKWKSIKNIESYQYKGKNFAQYCNDEKLNIKYIKNYIAYVKRTFKSREFDLDIIIEEAIERDNQKNPNKR